MIFQLNLDEQHSSGGGWFTNSVQISELDNWKRDFESFISSYKHLNSPSEAVYFMSCLKPKIHSR